MSTIKNIQTIPVVKDEDHSFLIGMLERREVIRVYNKRIEEMKSNEVTSQEKTDIL